MQDFKKEEDFFDEQGLRLLETKDSLEVNDPLDFLAGSSVAFEYAMNVIGDVAGKRILDYGCGSGWLAVYLAKMGAVVNGFDVSSKLIEVGIKRAEVNRVIDRVKLEKMVAEELNYPDDFFDIVVGVSILHHIDIIQGVQELARIMKKGAISIFIEPLGENIFLNFIRDFVERRIKRRRTKGEHPLLYKDIEGLHVYFCNIEYTEFQLFGMLERFIGYDRAKFLKLDSVDSWILDKFPFLKRFCRLVVIHLVK